ncbi:LOW QUALITY PROTEIN: uncharacterized protein FPRO_10482 [Fusarium proliferatum ET1]|uniref:Uncharacterized protein n=1 Tax=Fusarium proliferatum (strain ET1) TaxID=1227346 RepID=A0A1L7VK02_FUSPR|nr:LOW QUALITY PROTEIN: uncharacterized protein FPRO_10482 [Fusarium proliferatum ET1]CZR40893.1 uncharacterized protein FPRO_10482 [Fusarium proliferatum ET1]
MGLHGLRHLDELKLLIVFTWSLVDDAQEPITWRISFTLYAGHARRSDAGEILRGNKWDALFG